MTLLSFSCDEFTYKSKIFIFEKLYIFMHVNNKSNAFDQLSSKTYSYTDFCCCFDSFIEANFCLTAMLRYMKNNKKH